MRAWGGVGLELELEEAKDDDTDGAVKIHRTEQCEWITDILILIVVVYHIRMPFTMRTIASEFRNVLWKGGKLKVWMWRG